MASILIKEGPANGQELKIESDLVLGRENADLTIDDIELSRQHARIKPVDGALEIEDLGSLNGTWVNGTRIPDSTRLEPGDTVKLGSTVIEVIADPLPEIPEEKPLPEIIEEEPSVQRTLVGIPEELGGMPKASEEALFPLERLRAKEQEEIAPEDDWLRPDPPAAEPEPEAEAEAPPVWEEPEAREARDTPTVHPPPGREPLPAAEPPVWHEPPPEPAEPPPVEPPMPPIAPPAPPEAARAEARPRGQANLEWLAAAAAIPFTVLSVTAVVLPASKVPHPGAKQSEFLRFFAENHGKILVAFALITLAVLFFFPYLGLLWRTLRLAEGEPAWLSAVVFGTGISMATMAVAQNAFWGAAAHRARDGLDPNLARTLFDLGSIFYMAWLPLSMFLAAGAVLIFQTGVFPRWLGWMAAFASPLVLMSAYPGGPFAKQIVEHVGVVSWIIWTIGTGVVMMRRARTPRGIR